jgi:hypothetical protein
LKLIDGHLRRDLDPDMEVEVEVLDVTEEEARALLLSIDPLAALADWDLRLDRSKEKSARQANRLASMTGRSCAGEGPAVRDPTPRVLRKGLPVGRKPSNSSTE